MISRRDVIGAGGALAIAPVATAGSASIDETGFASVGGIDQWVSIRGRDRANPGLLFLHGGPGDAQSPFLSAFAPWEERWCVVQWDQRGSGKTFGRNGGSTPDITLERLAQDATLVAQRALWRLGRERLVLVGHSWGAIVGLHAIRKRPDLFCAFVGTGQPVSWPQSLGGMSGYVLRRARAEHNQAAIDEITAVDTLGPKELRRIGVVSKWLRTYASPEDKPYLDLQAGFVATPSKDLENYRGGGALSSQKLIADLLAFDALSLGLDLPIPFFVIQGRDDPRAPAAAAEDYVRKIRAPAKGFTAITGAHFACFTNPDGFLSALDKSVRRYCRL